MTPPANPPPDPRSFLLAIALDTLRPLRFMIAELTWSLTPLLPKRLRPRLDRALREWDEGDR